jgi:hypothetical protein
MKLDQNPYYDSNGKPQLKPSIVVFVDILGYKQLIETGKEKGTIQDIFQHLYSALEEAREFISPETKLEPFSKPEPLQYAMKCFTDNIVIGFPISSFDSEFELGSTIVNISIFQIKMTLSNYFVRGGIAIGDLFIDDYVVFGPGLTEAYELESKFAISPKIVLSNQTKQLVDKHLGYYASKVNCPYCHTLAIDSDGTYFINYLSNIIDFDNDHFFEKDLLEHKKLISEKLKEHKTNFEILNKYLWVCDYHNFWCSTLLKHPDKFLLEITPNNSIQALELPIKQNF